MSCPNCGDPKGGHFVPPCLGEAGFFTCEPLKSIDIEPQPQDSCSGCIAEECAINGICCFPSPKLRDR